MSEEFQFDNKWHLQPIKGDTGNTFMGKKDGEKVFIKRNSSPFLAVLSREGIAPKLVWTKRTSVGDILTAQEWLDGRLLVSQEVGKHPDVVRILQHLHHSESLKNMLYRVGGEEKEAFDFLSSYAENLPAELKYNNYLLSIFRYLEDHLPTSDGFQACHGDPTHNNWLLSDSGRLYLVDWDSTFLADPAADLGVILGRYVPYNKWPQWLSMYGLKATKDELEKIYWYSGMNILMRVKNYYLDYDHPAMNREISLLKRLYAY